MSRCYYSHNVGIIGLFVASQVVICQNRVSVVNLLSLFHNFVTINYWGYLVSINVDILILVKNRSSHLFRSHNY